MPPVQIFTTQPQTSEQSQQQYSSNASHTPLSPSGPAVSQSSSTTTNTSAPCDSSHASRRIPFFFREENSNLIVKGNFMTLSAKPEFVEKGEWLAHQVVEQNRLLQNLLSLVREVDSKTGLPLCNSQTCPTMSAAEFTYTWLDNKGNPVKIPAQQYISLVQKWIRGKIADTKLFPTDTSLPSTAATSTVHLQSAGQANEMQPGAALQDSTVNGNGNGDWLGKASGFPSSYEYDIKSLYRQMFRCYAHLYYGHWLEPFYHLGAYKELNTCFMHFVNVGKLYDLLHPRDLKPMQPLIDIWQSRGLLPPKSEVNPTAV